MRDFKFGIVITGGIGSGKSSVSDILLDLQYKVIDADTISHKMLDQSTDEIYEEFGKDFIEDGKISRKKLGEFVFQDRDRLKKLEKILHPKIRSEIYSQATILESFKKTYFVDIPLFFESSEYKEFKKILLIYAKKNEIIKRVMARNSLTKNEVLVRINSQIKLEEKKKKATFVIENTGTKCDLKDKVIKFLTKIKDIDES
ncbi:dephospho-CoA kinase [Campylobacter sp. FMV-PI01]|uniref:Dephospho-CoA kinase n=1 Tax=Campylobacter portucalensis TaxID=2608384 RepID=A0A6L5WMU9_9BACT|nr:dephospho-CoA kinase [Campylobacter portucalensis]MSN97143.1 dephospho-CoA kinase [Campylobacter portucalensis]